MIHQELQTGGQQRKNKRNLSCYTEGDTKEEMRIPVDVSGLHG